MSKDKEHDINCLHFPLGKAPWDAYNATKEKCPHGVPLHTGCYPCQLAAEREKVKAGEILLVMERDLVRRAREIMRYAVMTNDENIWLKIHAFLKETETEAGNEPE